MTAYEGQYYVIIIWGKSVEMKEFGEIRREIPEPMEVYHKI